MLDKFRDIVFSDFPDIKNCKIFLAISGGMDSMCLSQLLIKANIKHSLLHCNFQLRGDESEQDERFLKEYARLNKLEIQTKNFDTKTIAEETNENIQLTARNLRYNWFKNISNKKDLILTAHHKDDSIETFFLNLIRGTGIKGASGIPKINSNIYRPLSSFTSAEIESFVNDNNISFRQDSSNKDLKYRRNKIRHELIPLLEAIDPNAKTKIFNFIEDNRELHNFLRSSVDQKFINIIENHDGYKAISLSAIEPISEVLVRQYFSTIGVNRGKFKEFKRFLKSKSGSKFVTDSHLFYINRESLLIQSNADINLAVHQTINKLPFQVNTLINLELKPAESINLGKNGFQHFDFKTISLPLTLRTWKNGDKIIPLGMSSSKLVSDILIDKKINPVEKNRTLVLENSDGELISVLKICISETFKVIPKTTKVLSVSV